MSWCNVAEFKIKTGIKMNADCDINDALIQEALDASSTRVRDTAFYWQSYRSQSAATRHFITTPLLGNTNVPFWYGTGTEARPLDIADANADSLINVADLNVYTLSPNFVETDLTASITNFNSKYGIVDFASIQPTGPNILIIEYYIMKYPLQSMLPLLEELNRILAADWLFTNVPFKKLQKGITSWNINGVSVNFDLNAMKTLKEMNNEREKQLFNQCTILYSRGTRGRRPEITSLYGFRSNTRFY